MENHRKMTEEDFVWVNIDEEQHKSPFQKKKFKFIKHERQEKTFREKMKEGPQAITVHKRDLPSVTKILYPHLLKNFQQSAALNKH